jgi:hypothetical protein
VGQLYADWFRKAGAFDEIVLLMDCCRDLKPNIPPSGPVTPDVVSDRVDNVKYFYAMAAEVDSKSWEQPLGTPPQPRGVFSYVLMEALNTATVCDAEGKLTGDVLGAHLVKRVTEVRPDQMAKVKTSQFIGDIVFAVDRKTQPELRVTFLPGFENQSVTLTRDQTVVATHVIGPDPWPINVAKGLYRLAIKDVKQSDLLKIDGVQEVVDVKF